MLVVLAKNSCWKSKQWL